MRQVKFVPFRLTEAVDIYSIRIDGKENTEFQEFMVNFKGAEDHFLADDLDQIVISLKTMFDLGARERYFRNEGKLSDRIYALPLYTIPRSQKRHGTLRLYCIRVSDKLLLLGGGGVKLTQTYEEDEFLSEKVQTLQSIDAVLRNYEDKGVDLYATINNLTISI